MQDPVVAAHLLAMTRVGVRVCGRRPVPYRYGVDHPGSMPRALGRCGEQGTSTLPAEWFRRDPRAGTGTSPSHARSGRSRRTVHQPACRGRGCGTGS